MEASSEFHAALPSFNSAPVCCTPVKNYNGFPGIVSALERLDIRRLVEMISLSARERIQTGPTQWKWIVLNGCNV